MLLKDLVSPAVYALSAAKDENKKGGTHGSHYADLKGVAEKAASTALNSGKHEDHLAASEAHKDAADKAPSPEEKQAHIELAASHLRKAACAVQQTAETPAQKAARAITEKNHQQNSKPLCFSNISPAVRDGRVTSTIEEPALSLLAFSGAAFYALPGIEGPNNAGVEREGLPNPTGPKALTSLKDVLSVGKYQHPIQKWSLDVTPEKIKKYCAAFSEMKAAGVKVPIYADHKPGSANTLGYIKDMFQGGPDAIKSHPEFAKLPVDQAPLDPNKMYAIHEFNSPEAMKMAHGVNQVSVLIDKKMQDGTGKKYGEATRHIAITPEPIVPNQGGFCQLSLDNTNLVDVACLSLAH